MHVGHLAHLPDMCLQVHLGIKDNAKITGTGRRSNGGVPIEETGETGGTGQYGSGVRRPRESF